MTIIKLNASAEMTRDLDFLKKFLGATSYAEVVRRAIALEVILFRKLEESKSVTIQGEIKDGKEIEIALA